MKIQIRYSYFLMVYGLTGKMEICSKNIFMCPAMSVVI